MRVLNHRKIAPEGTWRRKVLHRVSALVPRGMVLPIRQGPLKGMKWINGSASPACWLGNYSMEESTVLAKTISPGSTVFDIGAQAGYHTLHLATLVGPTGLVYAFEPAEENISYLRQHLALNKISNVAVIESAVSSFEGISMFDQGKNCFSGHLSDAGSIPVRTIYLDKEIREGRLPIPDYLKVDVEGAELSVLMGAGNTLREKHPTILMETHQWIGEFASSREDCWRFLTQAGYKLKAVADSHIYACQDESRTPAL